MHDLKRTIKIFLDDCLDASDDDFLQAFGAPSDMAADMLRDVSQQEIHVDKNGVPTGEQQ